MSRLLKTLGIGTFSLFLNGCMNQENSEQVIALKYQKFENMIKEGKVITTSAQDYCLSKGCDVRDYDLVLVHGNVPQDLPENTEALAGYICTHSGCFATAMVPKKARTK